MINPSTPLLHAKCIILRKCYYFTLVFWNVKSESDINITIIRTVQYINN